MTGTSRRSRCRCRTAFVLCALATRRCSGFQAPLASVSREHRAVRLSSTLLGEVRPPAQARGARQGSRLCQGKSRVATAGWSLSLSGEGRGDAVSDGQGQQQRQQRPQRESDLTDVRHSQNPRRYMGADAGTSDARGVGGPTGDGRGKEWTVDLCSKRLSLLHRKLRQVKDLLAKQARNPGCLDEHQLVKVERKMDLKVEIAELESLRRDLRNAELSLPQDGSDRRTTTPAKTKGRLPPGPFAGGMQAAVANSGGSPGSIQEGSGARDEPEGGDYDGAGYTREGLKLASPRQRVRASDAATAATAAKGAALTRPKHDGDERPLEVSMPVSRAEDNTDTTAPSSGTEGAVAAALKAEFNWEQSDEDMRQENARLPPLAPEGVKPPAGGYPKRLSTLMSFCRVSDKDTCDILVAMGRVTVNGVVATEPGGRVDVLTDIIVANGIAVTLPQKIDNSDETRRPRADAGKRTGPIPKSEKNTWKAKTKYRWNMDDGLLASRTRKASNAKAFGKKRGGGGGGGYGDDGSW